MKRVKPVIKHLEISSKIIFIPVDFQTVEDICLFSFDFSTGIHFWTIFLHE